MASLFPFQTRAQLHQWLDREGLAHLAKLNLEAMAGAVDQAWWPQLRALGARRRLLDLASQDGLARWQREVPASPLREVLPADVWRFIDQQRSEAAAARQQLARRTVPPDDARTHAVFERLLRLRAQVPASVAPSLTLSLEHLSFEPTLPGFRFKDTWPTQMPLRAGGSFKRPEVTVRLTGAQPGVECTCGESSCVHALAALDTVGLWLRQQPSAAFVQQLQTLEQPAWARALRALDEALARPSTGAATVELWWHLRVVEGLGVDIFPWLPEGAKRGRRGSSGRGPLDRRRLQLEYAGRLGSADARLVALLPEGDGLASRSLIEALIEHPRLVLASAPEKSVRIERAALGLVADERAGAVQVGVGLEGAALPPALAERVRRARPDELLFVWDEGPRRLTLLDVKPELRTVLSVLQREGSVFPPESQPALLESLSRWSQRLPVAMPRSVLGEAVAPTTALVLHFEAHARGHVELQLKVRPLEGGGAFVPGEGARDVHVRRGERALHAVRDLGRERAAAEAFAAELPLDEGEAQAAPFSWRFDSAAPVLELVAFCASLVPAPEVEWVGQPVRSVGTRGPQALKVVLDQRRDWFGALGHLSVDGERVELARLLEAARRKEKYVQVQTHTWVELSQVLRRHLERLDAHVHVTHQGLELGPSAADALRLLENDGAVVEADRAWAELAQRVAAAKELSPRLPRGLKATLRPYQVEGFAWLARLAVWGAGAVLADDMGLGKTVQALAVLLDRAKRGPALVVAPTSVAFNWRDEAQRFAPSLRVTLYAEEADREQVLAALGPGDVLVVSYGLMVRDAQRLGERRFATMVFDEAQHLKNATTQRTRAARRLQADFKFALSGTPLENHVGELWSLFAVVFPGLLGRWDSFRLRFAAPIEKQNDPAAAPALALVLAPFLLRRTKAKVEAELPARTEVRVPVALSPAEWQLYEDARLAALSDLETRRSVMREQQRRVEVLAALTRLRLMASHPRLYDPRSAVPSSKLARCLELLEELRAEGQRALVFSQFTSHLALVREALVERGIECVSLDGQTPARARRALVKQFQEGVAPVFLISLKAGGFGLNLTAATNVIHLDPWWNPAVEDQASDRAHRLGQQRPVTIYRLVAMGTIEEQMLSLHTAKRALVSEVLSGKDRAGQVSTPELLAMLSRRGVGLRPE